MDEPDWDNSDASSDEDDEYSPLGLRDPFSERKTAKTQTTILAIQSRQFTLALSLPRILNNHTQSDPTSSTGSSPTLSVVFNEPVGLAIDIDNTATAIDVSDIIFGNDMMELLVEQTNLYAAQHPPSARYKWYNTCVTILYHLSHIGNVIDS